MKKLSDDEKCQILLKYVYDYGVNYGKSFYKDCILDVDEIINDWGRLDIYDAGGEVIGSGMLFEIVDWPEFDNVIFGSDFDCKSFYDLLYKYADYDSIQETFDDGMIAGIKSILGEELYYKIYPEQIN